MAYQNVGTPRFYVDHIQYLKATGFDFEDHYNKTYFTDKNEDGHGFVASDDEAAGMPITYHTYLSTSKFWTLSPNISKNPIFLDPEHPTTGTAVNIAVPMNGAGLEGDNIGRYWAILNHNMGIGSTEAPKIYSEVINQYFEGATWTYDQPTGQMTEMFGDDATLILNYSYAYWNAKDSGSTIFALESNDNGFAPENNKICYSRLVFSSETEQGVQRESLANVTFGGLSTGIYYDMPHSPDLKLTMDIEFDGYDTVTTKGGSTLTNIRYQGCPWWEDSVGNEFPPFYVGAGYQGWHDSAIQLSQSNYRRNGRRVWNLKFSYIDAKDLFASNYMPSTYFETGMALSDEELGYDSADVDSDNNVFNYTIDSDNSFMSLVWQKTLGGALPFIFQPDNTNSNPDQFCIARFDQKSLRISQVAVGVYNISIKIIETW